MSLGTALKGREFLGKDWFEILVDPPESNNYIFRFLLDRWRAASMMRFAVKTPI